MVIVEEKYFWKMYDSQLGNEGGIKNTINSNIEIKGKNSFDMMQSQAPKSQKLVASMTRENIPRFKVEEYIEIVMPSQGIENRKFTFYRSVEIEYRSESSQLIIINE